MAPAVRGAMVQMGLLWLSGATRPACRSHVVGRGQESGISVCVCVCATVCEYIMHLVQYVHVSTVYVHVSIFLHCGHKLVHGKVHVIQLRCA